MGEERTERFVPYERVSPGFEALYVGEKPPDVPEGADQVVALETDDDGNVLRRWSVWTWTFLGQEADWDADILHINRMQEALGPLDDETRRIRAHIGSLVPCDAGFPVTVEELLAAIGAGRLPRRRFHNGCFCALMSPPYRGTQPGHVEAVRAIEEILTTYLAGAAADELLARFPDAEGFIRRAYRWLGPAPELTRTQRLMIKRMLLPFEFFTKRSEDYRRVNRNCFEDGGRGFEIDAEISRLEGLPRIHPRHEEAYREALDTIEDPDQRELYRVCGSMAYGIYGLSDCHHSMFRWIENWVYGIGTGRWGIPARETGTERRRLERALFGYCLALDRWLAGRSMQFLLLDLAHVDLGFDPKNEILRVYAHLGEEPTPVRTWLAACLWRTLYRNMGGLTSHEALVGRAGALGVSVREWIDRASAEDTT